jgi:signal transduction histidine kinase
VASIVLSRLLVPRTPYTPRTIDAQRALQHVTAAADASRVLSRIVEAQREIIHSLPGLDSVMSAAAAQAQTIAGEAPGAALELVHGNVLVYRHATGIVAPSRGLRIAIEGTFAGMCVMTDAPAICPDTERDERVDVVACRSLGVRSIALVPLRSGGGPIGVVKVVSQRANAFTQAGMPPLAILAGMVGSAIEHAIEHERMARLTSFGRFSQGMIHEVNNFLVGVIGNLEHLETLEPTADAEYREVVADALLGARQIARMMEDLAAIERGDAAERSLVDLAEVTRAAVRGLKERTLVSQHHEGAPLVIANATQLRQVVLNLLKNAIEAVPASRKEPGAVSVVTRADEEGSALLEITDRGLGIAPEDAVNIFQPFFTTKHGKGTGLGLAISREIVEAHRGSIEVSRSGPDGTVLTVKLPPGDAAEGAILRAG